MADRPSRQKLKLNYGYTSKISVRNYELRIADHQIVADRLPWLNTGYKEGTNAFSSIDLLHTLNKPWTPLSNYKQFFCGLCCHQFPYPGPSSIHRISLVAVDVLNKEEIDLGPEVSHSHYSPQIPHVLSKEVHFHQDIVAYATYIPLTQVWAYEV